MKTALLAIQSLECSFNSKEKIKYRDFILKEENFFTIILGASGSGKTTLLHVLAGLIKPTRGTVIIDNQEITRWSDTQLNRFRKKKMAIIFQKAHLLRALTVKENIIFSQSIAREYSVDIEHLMLKLDIHGIAKKKISQISQGQAQRVAIAKALVKKPKWLLADEPTSSLDDKNCQQVIDLFLQHSKEYGAKLLIATHDTRIKNRFDNRMEL